MSSDEEDYGPDETDSGNESPEDEDVENDDFVMDIGLGEDAGGGPSGSGVGADKREEEYQYEVLTTEQIVEFMVKELKEVQNVIQIPTTTVRILLNHFKWDKEKLYEKYYTESRQEKIFEEAQLLSPFKVKEIAAKVKSASSKSPVAVFDCDICLLSLPKSSMTGLECGHLYCTTCWTEYLT